MSMIHASVDSAIAIAERRSGKIGAEFYAGRTSSMIERAFMAFKTSSWIIVLSGFVNPISYAAFIAPALLATSAMNGAIYDSTWNVFFKMHFGKLYQTILSTSLGTLDVALGEISWALLRGLAYAIGFMAVMAPLGLIPSWWGILAIPGAVLIAFAFASIGMGVTSYLKSFQQMNWVNFFLLPMFLFSGTFYPLDIYPEWLQRVIEALPLWHAIQLERALTLGNISPDLLWHVLYFMVMIVGGLYFTTRRLNALFLR